jgi:hypothetical protein
MHAVKIILLLLLVLVIAAAALAMVVTRQARSWPDCTSHIVIRTGPDGRPVECICVGATVSTCFDPGP